MSCERIVADRGPRRGTADIAHPADLAARRRPASIEAPGGAHFTECLPDYGRDEAFQKRYAATAKSDEAWDEFRAEFLDLDEDGLPGEGAESSVQR